MTPDLRDSLREALVAWTATWHPALSFGIRQKRALAARLYRLAVHTGGEPLDEEFLEDLGGARVYVVWAADQGLRYHLGRLATGLGQPVDPQAAGQVPSTPAIEAFRRHPSIATYVEVLRDTGGGFATASSAKTGRAPGPGRVSLEEAVLDQVGRAADAVAANPPPGGGARPIPATRSARLGRLLAADPAGPSSRPSPAAVSPLVGGPAPFKLDWAQVVSGAAYLDQALNLIGSAEWEIRVTMFFMTYRPDASHPANALVEALAAAHGRGVAVSVTLDLDRPGDVFGSRLVNRAAFDFLKAKGIDVAWDRPERLTHTKLLVVDRRDILVGSHNWTAGSIYGYDDQSLAIRSEALGGALTQLSQSIHSGG
jgi:hypothetical protein